MPWKKPFAKEYRRSAGFLSCAGLLFCLAARAQKPSSELPKDLLDLVQIKEKMRQNLTHLPDFTCVETMQRSRKSAHDPQFSLVDSLKLEVLYSGNKELHAWPGSHSFDERNPRFGDSGMFSDGEFASHAQGIFISGQAQIHFAGAEVWRGHDTLKYTFRIPAMMSGWTVHIGGASGVVGERGTFWADPATFEVLRLEISADEIPPALPVQSVEVGMEYGRVQIGSADILAPQQAELLLTLTDRSQSRNLVEFSQCRQYHAESAISFDTDADAAKDTSAATDAAAVQEIELPADLPLKLQLDKALDSDTAAQGDPITAHVTAAAELKGKIYIPQGALVRGRIRRLERYPVEKPYLIVGIEFSEIEFGNKRAAFLGRLDHMDPLRELIPTRMPEAKSDSSSGYRSMIMGGSNLNTSSTPVTETVRVVNLTGLELPGVGTFALEGRRVQLAAGFRMTWRTVSLAAVAVPPKKGKK
jgi:hypothetical protein